MTQLPNQSSVLNAMTIDVEDYFQVSAFDAIVSRTQWDTLESRVCRNTDRLLELFEATNVRATFFVLGWVADRFPTLVRRIAEQGHEIASHGFWHRLIYDQTPEQFREDIRRSREAISAAVDAPIHGYRAPSFSVTSRSLWALEILLEEGFAYDASVFPIHHDRYGLPTAPRMFHERQTNAGTIWECPGSTVRIAGTNLPIAGGGYFRLLPYAWTRWGMSRVNSVEGRPTIFYLHPWEIDPDQPRLQGSLSSRLRHYTNLHKTEDRLRRLMADFRFAPLSEVLRVSAERTTPV